jgi:DNA polymerase III epsilon subunit-like protein
MSNFYLAFDSETGGLNPKKADMLTLYMAVIDEDFKVLEELDFKLKPDGDRLPIAEAGALKVNGIDLRKHLEDPEIITYSEAKEKVVVMIKKYLKKNGRYSNIRPLGQNVQFDIDYVQEYVLPKDEWDSMVHYGKVDTKICVDFLKDCGWFPKDIGNLGSIVSYLNIPMGKAHTAKADTLACVEVYKKLLELMKSKKDNSQSVDLISLLEAE